MRDGGADFFVCWAFFVTLYAMLVSFMFINQTTWNLTVKEGKSFRLDSAIYRCRAEAVLPEPEIK